MEQESEKRQETRSPLSAWGLLAGLLIGSILVAFSLGLFDSPTSVTGSPTSESVGGGYSDTTPGHPSAQADTPQLPNNAELTPEPLPKTRTIYTETTVQLDGLDRKQFLSAGFEAPSDLGTWLPDICNDMETGGDGMLELGTPADVSAAAKENLQDLLKALSIKYLCPKLAASMGAGSTAQYIALTTEPAPERDETPDEGTTSEDWAEIQKYMPRNGTTGGGYLINCADGTTSHAGGKQGACSWHGGTR
ncbi:hypothetical protein [Arthrobacter rhombi]|uniref:hypothetical protein n=1 Tax=Arthrobacter rhombi TaxID=71253 RepID=UPI003FD17152